MKNKPFTYTDIRKRTVYICKVVEAEKEKLEKYTSMAAQVAERLSQLKK